MHCPRLWSRFDFGHEDRALTTSLLLIDNSLDHFIQDPEYYNLCLNWRWIVNWSWSYERDGIKSSKPSVITSILPPPEWHVLQQYWSHLNRHVWPAKEEAATWICDTHNWWVTPASDLCTSSRKMLLAMVTYPSLLCPQMWRKFLKACWAAILN